MRAPKSQYGNLKSVVVDFQGGKMAPKRTNLQERYELQDVLGKGGMGVVYTAIDTLMKRKVALKTILDVDNPSSIDLFYKEWSVLSTMVHPNIIGIYDIGEFEEGGMKKPFFVMPLLPGVALDRLIREGSPRLTVENVINIIDQAARGLHAAHEIGLVHRDVKPSNIFVMDDDSVKIIDFGIARAVSMQSKTNIKGTLFYLAPEYLELKPPTPLSDQFALGVVAYEALTRRRPFDGTSETDILEAIRHYSPPPVSELNPSVNFAISRVIHKALAKQPYHRFPNARDFAEALQKARRNEPLECFDDAVVKPRLEKARLSFEQGDYSFALDVLAELEGEGRLDPEIGLLRRQVDQAVRQTRIRQSLESARRCFAAAEYSLALRKIQDALDQDSEDADALSLKAQIERERREKKIEEWIQLAQKHLDNQAFGQARDALNNVLKLKPNDTVALELVAEVARREREISHAREEKGRLYQAAMQAWDKGDVTGALSKVEHLLKLDRDVPEADAGRTASYHTFYNQIQSEHNTIRNAYEEARRNLASDSFEAAMAICRKYLAKYPNHALFQALKYDVEERQRQALSALIAKTDRRVEEEADLHRRVAIVEEVLKLYPGESHFERALQLVRDKRDLVDSIVSKARYYEERNEFNEALDQWQILRSIHERHPGLAFEIERLGKKRDQQARENAKTMWVEQTDRCLEAGDYDGAARTIERALAEFPGESELVELSRVVHNSQSRGVEALQLLARARELGEKGELDAGIEALRQAVALAPRNTVIRTVLVNFLLEDSQRLLRKPDWAAAEARLRELLALNPNDAGALSLANEIADRKRDEFVSLCITQARRLQAEGDLAGALAAVAQGLETYPKEPRFEQLYSTLERALAEVSRQKASQKVRGAAAEPAPPAKPPVPAQASAAAPAAVSAANSGGPSATMMISAPAVSSAPTPSAAPFTPVAPAAPAPAMKPAAAPESRPAAVPFRKILWAAGGIAVVMLAVAGGSVVLERRQRPAPGAATYKVTFRSLPEGAAIAVNGKPCGASLCEVQLPPGNYEAQATLAGYQNAKESFTVAAGRGGPGEVRLTLEAPPSQITLSTDLSAGTLLVDGAPAAQIQDGELEVPKLSPGPHKLEVQSNEAKASLSLDFPSGSIPRLTEPIQAQGINAVVVASYGGLATVYSSAEGIPATLDGKPAGNVGAAGLELKDLAPGSHELQVILAGVPTNVPFESAGVPGIFASMLTVRNVGGLRIVTGDDDVTVYLNGEKNKRTTTRGRLRIFLPPKQYVVHIEKQGLWAADQTVEVRRGEEAKLEFKLIPAMGTLEVHNAPPGTEVLVDGTEIGSVRPDGGFSTSNIKPGKHSVGLKKDRFNPKQGEYVFEPGKSTPVEGALESANGTLKIEVPAIEGLLLRIQREGEAERPVTARELPLPEGTYTVIATAPGYQGIRNTVHLTAGGSAVAALTMTRIAVAKEAPKPRAIFNMEEWVKSETSLPTQSKWARDGKVWVKRGGEFVVAPLEPMAGTYTFTVNVMKGKRLEWVWNYKDAQNYDLFQLGEKNLVRTRFVDGKKAESVRTPDTTKINDYTSITVVVTDHSIVHSIYRGKEWLVLDKWDPPGGGLQGKFGFHVSGKDQIAVSEFRFTAP